MDINNTVKHECHIPTGLKMVMLYSVLNPKCKELKKKF